MSLFRDRSVAIHGIEIPRRRFTRWAAVYFVMFICLPVFAIAFVLDYLIYVLMIR